MEEEMKEAPEEEQSTDGDTPSDDNTEGMSLLEKTIAATERLEKANAEFVKNLERQERLMSQQMLAGRGAVGKPEEKKKMTREEYTRYIEAHGRAPENEQRE